MRAPAGEDQSAEAGRAADAAVAAADREAIPLEVRPHAAVGIGHAVGHDQGATNIERGLVFAVVEVRPVGARGAGHIPLGVDPFGFDARLVVVGGEEDAAIDHLEAPLPFPDVANQVGDPLGGVVVAPGGGAAAGLGVAVLDVAAVLVAVAVALAGTGVAAGLEAVGHAPEGDGGPLPVTHQAEAGGLGGGDGGVPVDRA